MRLSYSVGELVLRRVFPVAVKVKVDAIVANSDMQRAAGAQRALLNATLMTQS
ncbi:hypothetical protein DPMN_098201 [Dreissena polymorpha]|uniref:Uncharacterized protein n=1 Tax=Dreissena polymorpha TaxID=45954 RepID=A0A9D4R595_DREPO|nr:hypothetical protein DPMN_098201 [Dreissena polymorpha]